MEPRPVMGYNMMAAGLLNPGCRIVLLVRSGKMCRYESTRVLSSYSFFSCSNLILSIT